MEATDELMQGDSAIIVDVKLIKYTVSFTLGHLQLRTDGEKLFPLDPPRVVSVVCLKEGTQPVPLLCAHSPWWLPEYDKKAVIGCNPCDVNQRCLKGSFEAQSGLMHHRHSGSTEVHLAPIPNTDEEVDTLTHHSVM